MRLFLDPPDSIARSYVRPGQYIAVNAGGKAAYFVLSGDPGDATWELLIRPGGEVASSALGAAPGDRVSISAALGTGFPMHEAEGRELLVVVTGSGVAAARPVVRARARTGQAAATTVLVGVRTAAEVPVAEDLSHWSQSGAKVTVCLSREAVEPGKPGFAAGYVQDAARASWPGPSSKKRIIFAAGVKEMIEAMRVIAKDLGAEESDVRTNY